MKYLFNRNSKVAIDRKNPLYGVMNKHLQLAGKIITSDKVKVISYF